MRSRAAAALLALAGLFLIVGVAAQRWELVSLVMPLAAVTLLYNLLWRPFDMGAIASWKVEGENIFAGDVAECSLAISYEGKGGGMGVIEVDFPPSAEVIEGSRSLPVILEHKGVVNATFKLRFPRRGLYRLGPVRISTVDLAGFTSATIDVDSTAEVRVLPQVFQIDSPRRVTSRLHLATGNMDSRLLGTGMEFFSLRDYVPGDGLKMINWKATARSDVPVVNQFMTQRNRDVVIALNIGNVANPNLIDAAIDMAATLTGHFVEQRDRVGLAIFADHYSIVPLGYGSRQFYRCLEALTEIRRCEEHTPLRIAELLDRLFSPNPLIILIADLKDQGMVEVAEDLVWRGKELLVISPFLQPNIEDTKGRMDELRRQDRAWLLSRICQVEEWDGAAPATWVSARGGR